MNNDPILGFLTDPKREFCLSSASTSSGSVSREKKVTLSLPFDLEAFLQGLLDTGEKKDEPVKSITQIAKSGTFHSSRYGEFTLDEAVFDDFISNFEKGTYGTDPHVGLPYDAEHLTELGALGWIQKLFKGVDNRGKPALYAEVEWTKMGADCIRDKRFKYTSPTFYLNFVDNETLEEHKNVLAGAAMTCDPFLRGMMPLSLSKDQGGFDAAVEIEETSSSILQELCDNFKALKEAFTNKESKKEEPIVDKTELANQIREMIGASPEEIKNSFLELKKAREDVEKMKGELSQEKERRLSAEKQAMQLLSDNIAASVAKDVTELMNGEGSLFKQDMAEPLTKFATQLKRSDSGVVTLSKDERLYDSFMNILKAIPRQKNTINMTAEIGHSIPAPTALSGEEYTVINGENVSTKSIQMKDKIEAHAKKHNMSYVDAFNALLDAGEIS